MEEQVHRRAADVTDEIELIDLIRIIWKHRLLVVIVPILFGVAAYGISLWMKPTYESSAQIVLSNMDDPVYSDAENAKALLLSRDTLAPIMEELDLPFHGVGDFKKTLQVEGQSKRIAITMKYHDPKVAQAVVDRIVKHFMEQSNAAYLEKRKLVEEMRSSLLQLQQATQESLARNKAALASIEANPHLSNEEKDITRARLIDYISRDEYSLKDFIQQIQQIDQQLLSMKEAQIIEQPTLPRRPVAPKKGLNAIIGFVLGLMLAFVYVFIRAYFEQYGYRLKDDWQKTVGV
ncbi:Wzz/FepE/Etk N-terminal domain-containing protein [Hydrogenibacillus sp. N12]|uniref:YveK family protein n=1 Tax=Hydrogenibacillus sp. N12 TaxID=2866627 RepID=UPI001C7C9DED|nr:Wzz/FepE/Etk N-terminal domain-containing protein [Hydrogenibacillus sp. N12]QZA32876.1 hypothetical protein K2M58_11610 [Hydrogenibacillus sp. N12]